MSKSVLFLLLVSMLFIACIPTQDLIYLQNKKNSDVVSTVLSVESKPYRLQTNDSIGITMKAIDPTLVTMFNPNNEGNIEGKSKSELYFSGFTFDDHGVIRIPILGELNVIGYTLEEIRVRIEKQLLAEYCNKEVTIFVTFKLEGLRFTINRETGNPGAKMLFQEQVTIMEAHANAGDNTITGDCKAVTVMRKTPAGVVMQDIDLIDSNAMQSPFYFLQPNDYIYIKPLQQKFWGT